MAENGVSLVPNMDSETSVDYYVTTVKPLPAQDNAKLELAKVVSVDRAGSVKLRKRKKSKRRKKRLTNASEDGVILTSDEDMRVRSSSSDDVGNVKLVRRSISLTERDLQKNKKQQYTDEYKKISESMSNKENKAEKTENLPPLEKSVVRRRVKKKNSFRVNRGGIVLDDTTPNGIPSLVKRSESLQHHFTPKPSTPTPPPAFDSSGEKKFIDQKSALATLDAFMSEVQEATTVAKQQHEEKATKEISFRRSRSLSDLTKEAVTELDGAPSSGETATRFPPFVHQKSESLGQTSVFLSEPDVSIESSNTAMLPSSVDSVSDKKKSLHDLVMATDFATLTELLFKKVSERNPASQKSPVVKRQAGTDYGLAHLEQVCKLMEQIANLRSENQALKQRVVYLESRMDENKQDFQNGMIPNDSYQFPRSRQVNRSPDVRRISKSSLERNQTFDGRLRSAISSQSTLQLNAPHDVFDKPLSSSAVGSIPTDRPVIYSNVSLKKKRRAYSRDDLELSNKGRWKFWRAPAPKTDNTSSKKQVVSSIKNQHTQGSATHLKSASVTLDSLLNSIDNDFSQKMLQWEAASRPSRAPSRASVTSTDTVNRNVHSSSSKTSQAASDDNTRLHFTSQNSRVEEQPLSAKGSGKKRMSRWERAARKLSWHGDYRRSKSMDRINVEQDPNSKDSLELLHSTNAMKDFYKSMPCVMTESQASAGSNGSLPDRDHSGNRSTEWSALQEAFPTNKSSIGDPIRRLISASQSRLAAPLRKKTNKRRSWSFTKRPSSKFFLPTSGDFANNLEMAESIGEQYTLQLDQEDVKSINNSVKDDELSYLRRNTLDLREKLREMEKVHEEEDNGKKVAPARKARPASSMARLHNGQSVRSFRRSRLVANKPLSSSDHVTGAMSPLQEEALGSIASLPDFQPPAQDDSESTNRRHTISSWHVKKRPRESGCAPEPEVELPCDSDSLVTPVVSYISQKVSTVVRSDSSISKRPTRLNVGAKLSDMEFGENAESAESGTTAISESAPRKRISGKLLSQIIRFSPKNKSRRGRTMAEPRKTMESSSTIEARENSQDSVSTATSSELKTPKKKRNIFKAFSSRRKIQSTSDDVRDKPSSPAITSSDNDVTRSKGKPSKPSPKMNSPKKNAPKTDDVPVFVVTSSNNNDDVTNARQSSKIAELSHRLSTGSERSRSWSNQSNGLQVKKGLVSRLSKRFNRTEAKGSFKSKKRESNNNKN